MRSVWIYFSATALAAVMLAGCASNFRDSLSGNAAAPGEAPSSLEAPTDHAEVSSRSAGRLQQEVMDFSDRYSTNMGQAIDAYIAGEPEVAKQVRAQRLRLGLATASMTIAASLDPRANLLDMAVFISAGRWAADRYWTPELLGEKTSGLREVYAQADREIWDEVNRILTPAQSADLRALIDEWKKTADPRDVVNVRLRNLDGVVLSRFQESASAKGLLASVKRLLGKVDQSLLYGERMMFYLERTPLILSQQADLTVDRVAERFPIATVNPDFKEWSAAVQDFGRGLPRQFNDVLTKNEGVVREVMPQIQGSLESVEHITVSLQGTVNSANTLATTIGKLPFKPEDYVAALDHAAVSLDKIDSILTGLNRLLDQEEAGGKGSQIGQIAHILDERADRAIDDIYQRALWLIGALIGGLLLVVIVARLLFPPRRAEKSG